MKGGASSHFVVDAPFPGIKALIINILYVFTMLICQHSDVTVSRSRVLLNSYYLEQACAGIITVAQPRQNVTGFIPLYRMSQARRNFQARS